jgi:ElaB/YqjD/DUF883 family membrane-anchored ribosome-binding protein
MIWSLIMPRVSDTKEKLIDDFNGVVSEAEQLLKSVANESSDKTHELLSKLERNLRLAKERVVDFQDVAVERTKAAARATDDYVHEHPWRSIGVAAALGVVVGLLLNRR